MRKIIFSILCMLFTCISIFADNAVSIYADNLEAKAGDEFTLSVNMKNSVDVIAFAFHLVLPEGVSIVQEENEDEEMVDAIYLTSRKKSDHTLSIMQTAEGNTQIVGASSSATKTFRDSDGAVVTIKLKVADNAGGAKQIGFKNISFSELGNISHEQDEYTIQLSLPEKEQKLDVELYADNLEAKAGDEFTLSVNMKNSVDVIAFAFHLVLPEGVSIVQEENEDEEMVDAIYLTSRKKSDHTLSIMQTAEGNTQIVGASSSATKTFKDSDGAVVTIKLKVADNASGAKEVGFKNISFSELGNISHEQNQFSTIVTIEAATPVQYAITFMDGEDVIKSESLDYGSTIVVPDTPTKEGYTFVGWSPEVAATVPANDVTYTATWEINKYTVSFMDGEDAIKSESLDYGSTIVIPDTPTKEGYTFVGWSPEVAATVPANDVTYTATWEINKYIVSFMDGEDVIKSESLDYGSTIVIPDTPTKEGYTFVGWSPEVAATVPANDITYTATWEIPVSISSVSKTNDMEVCYTLQGIKVTSPIKGKMYIVNGVKKIWK